MYLPSLAKIAFVATCSFATVEASPTGYNNIPIVISANNNYNGDFLIGHHVSAGMSYIAAASPGSGSGLFGWNFYGTSQQLLHNSTEANQMVPCYVVSSTNISSNSGPLECGGGDQSNYYDVAVLQLPSNAIAFQGVQSWWICDVQNEFNGAWISDTVVGVFVVNAVPVGGGLTGCTPITSIVFVPSSSSSLGTSSSPQQVIEDTVHAKERPEL